MTNSAGKLVIGAIFVVALSLAGYAWWHQLRSNPQARAFWGHETAALLTNAARVEYLELASTSESPGEAHTDSTVRVRQAELAIEGHADISQVPGLLHARHALIEDASYEWTEASSSCEPSWEFALRMRDDEQVATVAFDPKCGTIWWVEGGRALHLNERVTAAFRKKQADWMALVEKK